MMRRWVGTWIVALLAIGAVAVAWIALRDGSAPSEESHADRPIGEGPGLTLEGQPRPPPASPPSPNEGTNPKTPLRRLDQVLELAPHGKAEEWLLARIGSAPPPPDWLTSVLSRIVQTTSVPSAPFQIHYVFGQSDRIWLESLASEVERELEVRRRTTPSPVSVTAVWDELAAEVSAYLADIAAARVAAQPELKALFEDRRSLRDLEVGSPEAVWLAAMIEEVSNPHLWSTPDLLTAADKPLVTAADLEFLREASTEIWDVWRFAPRAEDRPRATQDTRAVVLRVYDRLAPRRR